MCVVFFFKCPGALSDSPPPPKFIAFCLKYAFPLDECLFSVSMIITKISTGAVARKPILYFSARKRYFK